MKRDMELVRKLLFFFEGKSDSKHVQVPPIEGYSEAVIKYHCTLLYDAGLVFCEPVKSTTSDRPIYVIPFELSWAGHEFLEKIRSETIWAKVKSQAQENSVSLSFNIINELAQRAIMSALGALS